MDRRRNAKRPKAHERSTKHSASPGCARTDQELSLLLRHIAEADEPVMFRTLARTVPAHLAFDHQVHVLRHMRKAGSFLLDTWRAADEAAQRNETVYNAQCSARLRRANNRPDLYHAIRDAITRTTDLTAIAEAEIVQAHAGLSKLALALDASRTMRVQTLARELRRAIAGAD